ncbi:MAG TPA: NADAR family protein [Longimicrobium sp.]|nr:NADAR family protein [Longimicrobium sp.]
MEFTFFWGERSPLSQWHRAVFALLEPWEGAPQRRVIKFGNAEQWMMAAKAAHFRDQTSYLRLLSTPAPQRAKALGRLVTPFDPAEWSRVARGYVRTGNLAKFSQNQTMREHLLATGNSLIVEASPYDRIWGIGLRADHPDARNPARWRGTNWLGEVLMDVREALGGAPAPARAASGTLRQPDSAAAASR